MRGVKRAVLFGVMFLSVLADSDIMMFDPNGDLKRFYEEGKAQTCAGVRRFVSEHNKRQLCIREMNFDVSDFSLIWCEPIFQNSEFASVFWGEKEILVAMSDKKLLRVEVYALAPEIELLRARLMNVLKPSDYVCPVGGDGNVALIGAFLKVPIPIERYFSIQIGSLYRHSAKKMFCGTAVSVDAYSCISCIRDHLRKLVDQKQYTRVVSRVMKMQIGDVVKPVNSSD